MMAEFEPSLKHTLHLTRYEKMCTSQQKKEGRGRGDERTEGFKGHGSGGAAERDTFRGVGEGRDHPRFPSKVKLVLHTFTDV